MLSSKEQHFLLTWTGIVAIGWFLSSLAFGTATIAINLADMYGTSVPSHHPVLPIALGNYLVWNAIMWASIGFMQWGCVQEMISGTVWWRLGWSGLSALSWTLFWVLMYSGYVSGYMIESALSGAFLIGLVQWVFVRWHLVYAGWWIGVNVGAVGIIYGIAAVYAMIDRLAQFNRVNNWPFIVAVLCVPGLVYGVMTGLVMVLLMRTTIHRHQFGDRMYHSTESKGR